MCRICECNGYCVSQDRADIKFSRVSTEREEATFIQCSRIACPASLGNIVNSVIIFFGLESSQEERAHGRGFTFKNYIFRAPASIAALWNIAMHNFASNLGMPTEFRSEHKSNQTLRSLKDNFVSHFGC